MAVYFITCRKSGTVKIGCAYDPYSRLKQLQTGSPTKLKIEAVLKGSAQRERELHKLLAKYRVRGEWFRISPAIEAIIKEAGRPTRIKSLAESSRKGWDELNEDKPKKPVERYIPAFAKNIGFPDPLPPPRVSPGFDERLLSKADRRRIATGDIIFPFRAAEAMAE